METKEIKINLPIDITTLDEIGNYFRTKEQAEQSAKEIRDIFEKHKND